MSRLRRALYIVAGLSAAALLLAAWIVWSRDEYSGPVSDHFNGRHFFNPEGEEGRGGARKPSVHKLYDAATGAHHDSWPTVAVTPTVPLRRVDGAALRVTWIGHATVLVQTEGHNILLDPVWAERDSPVSFLGPRRMRAPGVRLADLPRIDTVLISHNHYDHLDLAALGWLWRRDRPLIVAGLGVDTLLRRHGIGAVARDWGGRVALPGGGGDVVVERAHHWSGRWLLDRNRTLWCGFTIVLPGGNVYYAGDTGPGDMRWAALAAARGPIRLAILPIGAFKPGLAESGNHISPVEAVDAFETLHAAYGLGVHWGTFELTNEGIDEPPTLLRATLAERRIAPGRFVVLVAGRPWPVPPLSPPRTPPAR